MYLLGIKMHPANADLPLPLILAAPESSGDYFQRIDDFLKQQLGPDVDQHYQIITGGPQEVAQALRKQTKEVRKHRIKLQESFSYNWGLTIPEELQHPFHPTHEAMAALELHREQPVFQLLVELRKAFSGIVAGNVKDFGIRAIAAHGPYQLHGDPSVIDALAQLLQDFVNQGRMKIDAGNYTPCFELR